MQITITIPDHAVAKVRSILAEHDAVPTTAMLMAFFESDVMAVYFDSQQDERGLVESVRDFWNV